MNHRCEPTFYPKSLDETWTCPECSTEYRVMEPSEVPELYRSAVIGLGWTER